MGPQEERAAWPVAGTGFISSPECVRPQNPNLLCLLFSHTGQCSGIIPGEEDSTVVGFYQGADSSSRVNTVCQDPTIRPPGRLSPFLLQSLVFGGQDKKVLSFVPVRP